MTVSTTPAPPIFRSPRFWALTVVALTVGFVTLTVECAQTMHYGTCIARDTSTVATNVTQSQCTGPCPTCSWQQNR